MADQPTRVTDQTPENAEPTAASINVAERSPSLKETSDAAKPGLQTAQATIDSQFGTPTITGDGSTVRGTNPSSGIAGGFVAGNESSAETTAGGETAMRKGGFRGGPEARAAVPSGGDAGQTSSLSAESRAMRGPADQGDRLQQREGTISRRLAGELTQRVGNVSNSFAQKVEDGLARLPSSHLQLLKDQGVKVNAAGSASDIYSNPDAKVFEGAKVSELRGVFDSETNEVSVFERAKESGRNVTMNDGGMTAFITAHETGHALDWHLGVKSERSEFKAAFNQDVQAMGNIATRSFQARYFTNPQTGPRETFANLYAYNAGVGDPADATQFKKRFPNSQNVVSRLFR